MFLFILTPPLLAAQDVAFRAGPVISSLSEGGPGSESRSGFLVGLDYGLVLSDGLALRPGLFHLGKGADVATTIQGVDITGGIAINYLQFSLPLQRTFGDGRARFDVQIGPWFALQVGCEVTGAAEGVSATTDCDEDTTGLEPVSSDMGLLVGLGISYGISNSVSFELDASNHVGFTDVFAGDNPAREKTRTWAFRLGLALGS
ncbi:outer membrane beta-barrel protein [Candidatus Palauibacter sp.]|uniref:outer membrane beta-barrel protein n=1 Tax=Candidatus Palauibacter sp. TaxID=3101350 RepID=UPI003CC650C5